MTHEENSKQENTARLRARPAGKPNRPITVQEVCLINKRVVFGGVQLVGQKHYEYINIEQEIAAEKLNFREDIRHNRADNDEHRRLYERDENAVPDIRAYVREGVGIVLPLNSAERRQSKDTLLHVYARFQAVDERQ